MLPPEQVEQIKKQITQHIDATFPEDKKVLAKSQVESMNSEQLEEFLEKNNLIRKDGQQTNQCVFCSIVFGNIDSYKIDENPNALAVLEINPISKSHIIVIPKEHLPSSDKIPENAFLLAKKISEKIKPKFSPKEVLISSSNLFGHEIINVLPIYKNETLNSARKPAKKEELEEIQKKLVKKERQKKEIVKKPRAKKIDSQKIWLPKRIP